MFETFECSGQNLSNSLCQAWNDKSIPLQILYPSSVSWMVTPLYFFSLNNIYFPQKEPIKLKIFETFKCSGQNLSNSWCQFLNNKLIPPNFLFLFNFMKDNSSVLAQTIYTFLKRSPLKWNFWDFQVLRSKFVKFLACELWNDKSVPLKILYLSSVSWKITPLYFFSSNNIYFAQKEPIKVRVFETFEYSGQNLSNFLY